MLYAWSTNQIKDKQIRNYLWNNDPSIFLIQDNKCMEQIFGEKFMSTDVNNDI